MSASVLIPPYRPIAITRSHGRALATKDTVSRPLALARSPSHRPRDNSSPLNNSPHLVSKNILWSKRKKKTVTTFAKLASFVFGHSAVASLPSPVCANRLNNPNPSKSTDTLTTCIYAHMIARVPPRRQGEPAAAARRDSRSALLLPKNDPLPALDFCR
ncbi:hypothetical protein IF2G_01871 [Cordyceps javanica]|nr:hypothetical protein IF2G_01871 [Cordyceps javanica]